MAAEDKLQCGNNGKSKKRKQRYLPHNKPVKKGTYPILPGVQGFFVTCDCGREKQASHEAINVIDSFYEELVNGEDSGAEFVAVTNKPLIKVTKFSDSDSSSDEDNANGDEDEKLNRHEDENSDPCKIGAANHETLKDEKLGYQKEDNANLENQPNETEEMSAKKQRLQTDALNCEKVVGGKTEEKSIDKLIEAELKELGDRNKRRFVSLDSGCNGIIFVQMHERDGDPSPKDIAQHMMMSAASTRKHMSRFILRVLPVEVTCYASEEELSKAIKPLIAKYFPAEAPTPQKFAVLYDARANAGIERMSIINSVAKSVPGPHKVDLNNPGKTILVQVVKTICLIGVVENYKELSKYNLRQLTSPKP
ncbi:THUMP domain-containing protein 1 homolog [Telopea speciosissima]|uniref:THUMP domain-containing protein 1 homolog n=1 Tax=Telopea speciosissima TaxID=54955 RepID=UPI001CC5BCB2|nr:THUMP domain-containing protein 1 homolog [Telopea speciosissima]